MVMMALSTPLFVSLAALTLSSCAVASPLQVQVSRYTLCQTLTPIDPLLGCPPGTIYVSATDERANFTTVQAAVLSLPLDNSARTILIGAGNYTEQVNVTRPGPLTLLGESSPSSITKPYADIQTGETKQNKVQIWWDAANSNSAYPDNVFTDVLTVGPTLNATLTGAGPTGYPVDPATPMGCSDFKAYNIDFRNEFAPRSSGPSLTYSIAYANASFYSCGFYSWQDTIFVGKLGNVFMHDAIIAGQTDYIYGFGTLWVEKSTLVSRSCSYVTAMKGLNTTFPNKYGAYISNSRLISNNATVLNGTGKCSLGRPWNSNHHSVFMNTYLDPQILPAGYTEWPGAVNGNIGVNTTMAVYNVYGPGNNVTAQQASNLTKIFTTAEVAPYSSPVKVFMTPQGKQPNVAWIDPLAYL